LLGITFFPDFYQIKFKLGKYQFNEHLHVFLAYRTGVSVSFTHAGNFIWHGGCQMSRVPNNNVILAPFMNEPR
jgi:hypothetical protein